MALHPPARQPGAAPQTPARPPHRPAPRPAAAAGTGLNHSKLVQLLAEWTADSRAGTPALPSPSAGAPALAGSGTPLAERLGRWLGVHEAIGLAGALKQLDRLPAADQPPNTPPHPALAQLGQARQALIDQTGQAEAPGRTRRTRPGQPSALPTEPAEDPSRFAPHLRAYRTRQQRLADGVARLRQQARQALADSGPAGARLAALDQALAEAVQAREQALLASVPLLMERRFEQLRAAAEPEASPETPAPAARPGTATRALLARQAPKPVWLQQFEHDAAALLHAEATLRLTPVDGLLAALHPPAPPAP